MPTLSFIPQPGSTRGRQLVALKERLDVAQCRKLLEEFPNDLVFQACRELVPDPGLCPIHDVLGAAHRQPHVALCLVEEALPAYLAKLAHIEQEARRSQERLRVLHAQAFPSQTPRAPGTAGRGLGDGARALSHMARIGG